MFKKALLTSALLLGTATASLAAGPFAEGWNLAMPTNCLFIPGNPGSPGTPASTPPVPATPAVPDSFELFVELVEQGAPTVPPPPPIQGSFTTGDPIAISVAIPFCKDGTKFYFWWDGTKATYFSMWPFLNAS